MPNYGPDLAYIHDSGFTGAVRGPGLLRLLRRHKVSGGLVVDLGCGSGRWARQLNDHGYRVFGVDQSPAMIGLARRLAPQSKFKVASLLDVELPACDAVTSIGECLNYAFDRRNSRAALKRLFRRVFRALRPGGVFVFDVAEPGRIPARPERHWIERADDWTILVEIDGDRKRGRLKRRIISFRKMGKFYRQSEETHDLRLHHASDLMRDLERCGFRARKLPGYGQFRLLPGVAAVLAGKPRFTSDTDARAASRTPDKSARPA
jgi:SAM-dependent methyltransferase